VFNDQVIIAAYCFQIITSDAADGERLPHLQFINFTLQHAREHLEWGTLLFTSITYFFANQYTAKNCSTCRTMSKIS
jgi:hypothetical protein